MQGCLPIDLQWRVAQLLPSMVQAHSFSRVVKEKKRAETMGRVKLLFVLSKFY